MDINRLKYFAVVCELKHVRKAADLLRINPASLSKSIKTLEQEVGHKLVVPAGRGIDITDQGVALYQQSRPLLREHAAFMASLGRRAEPEEQQVRLGSMEIFTTYFLSEFLRRETPQSAWRTLYVTPGQMEEALRSRAIDIGLSYVRLAEETLDYLKAGEFRMRIFGSKSLSHTRFRDLPFAVPIDGVNTTGVSLRCLDSWPDELFPRLIRYEFELLETALQTARQGLSVVYCPDFVARLHNQFVLEKYRLIEIAPPAGFQSVALPLYIVKRKNEAEGPMIRKIARALRSLKHLAEP